MTVYVESNFLLELAFEQEQVAECGELLVLAEAGRIRLVFPAYGIGECLERLGRRYSQRAKIQQDLRGELDELRRSASTAPLSDQLRQLTASLVDGAVEDRRRYDACLLRLIACATLVPLDATVIRESLGALTTFGLKTRQDALILVSVLSHLTATTPAAAVFINKNTRDFSDNSDIRDALAALGCLLKPDFRAGLAYLNANLPPP